MKRSSLYIATFLTVFSMAGCATMSVKTDYDRNKQFPSIRTFAWAEQPEKPVRNPMVQNSLMDKRVRRAVQQELEALGYEKDLEKPALLVVYHTGLEDKIDVSPRGYGHGGYYDRGYGGHGYGYGGYYGRRYGRGYGGRAYGYGYHGRGYGGHGYDYGGYYGRGYGGGGSYLRTYKEGTLILDFVDPETMQLIWRGWATFAFDDPDKAARYVNKAVKKILKKFPPQDDQARS